jgi:tRNA(Ile)-lysidine synthase
LLSLTRGDIIAYLTELNQPYRDDSTNADARFTRNRIRHELLPQLETYNPNILSALSALADRMAADDELIHNAVDQVWPVLAQVEHEQAVTFDLAGWSKISTALQRGLLRRAITHLQGDLRNIEFSHVEQAINLLTKGHTGTYFNFPTGLNLSVEYETARLAAHDYYPSLPDWPLLAADNQFQLNVPGATMLPGGRWTVHTTLLDPADVTETDLKQPNRWLAYFDYDRLGSDLRLRRRQPGDSFAPFGLEGHSQRLKTFMIDQKIPAAHRDHIPLLISEDDTIHWVCGWRTGHQSQVTSVTNQILQVQFR